VWNLCHFVVWGRLGRERDGFVRRAGDCWMAWGELGVRLLRESSLAVRTCVDSRATGETGSIILTISSCSNSIHLVLQSKSRPNAIIIASPRKSFP